MNKIYSDDKRYQFEVVDKIPFNYQIWHVNKSLIEGYIPLIQLSQYQDFAGGRNINTETMKAIKCEDYAEIMDNYYMIKNVNHTEKWAKENENNSKKKWEIKCIKKSLPLIKQLNGWENLTH